MKAREDRQRQQVEQRLITDMEVRHEAINEVAYGRLANSPRTGEYLTMTRLKRLFDGTIAKSKPVSTTDDLPARLARGGYPEATQRGTGDRRSAWFASS